MEEKYYIKLVPRSGMIDDNDYYLLSEEEYQEELDILLNTRGAMWSLLDNEGNGFSFEEAQSLILDMENELH